MSPSRVSCCRCTFSLKLASASFRFCSAKSSYSALMLFNMAVRSTLGAAFISTLMFPPDAFCRTTISWKRVNVNIKGGGFQLTSTSCYGMNSGLEEGNRCAQGCSAGFLTSSWFFWRYVSSSLRASRCISKSVVDSVSSSNTLRRPLVSASTLWCRASSFSYLKGCESVLELGFQAGTTCKDTWCAEGWSVLGLYVFPRFLAMANY